MAQNIPFFLGGAQQQQNATPVQHPHPHHQPQTPQTPSHPPPPTTTNNGAQQPAPPALQMAFQQNGALPAIPGMDLNTILQSFSPQQLALIGQLFTSGAFQIPPSPAAPPTNAPAAPPPPAPPAQAAPQIHTQPTADPRLARQKQTEDVDMDKEDGEVEEGELDGTPESRSFLSTPPKGPKGNASEATRRVSQYAGQSLQQQAQAPTPPQQTNGHAKPRTAPSKDAAVTAFILEMHKAGYSFEQIAKEVSSAKALRAVYQKLGLPLNPVNGTALTAPQLNVQTPPAASERKTSVTKRPPPAKAPNSQDRSAYLAKLQAAKNKKAESAATSPTSPKPTENALPKPELKLNVKASPQPAAPTPTAKKVNVQTELVRQRLEALKAERAAKLKEAPSSSDGAKASSPSVQSSATENGAQQTGLGDGLMEAATQASRNSVSGTPSARPPPAPVSLPQSPAAASAVSPSLNRGSGLPGLFTTGMPQPSTAAQPPVFLPQRSHSSLSNVQTPTQPPQSRPASTGPRTWASNVAGMNGASTQQQPPGYFWRQPVQESFIITDSDEESGEEMEIDDGPAPDTAISGLKQDLARLESATKQKPTSSSIPGTTITSGVNLQRDIDKLKAAIAEKEKMKQAKSKAKLALQSGTDSGAATPLSETAPPTKKPEPIAKASAGPTHTLADIFHNGPRGANMDTNSGLHATGEASAPPPVVDPRVFPSDTAENDEDSFDDADLYDADDGVELPVPADDGKVGSQATTITAFAQSQAMPADGDALEEDPYEPQAIGDVTMGQAEAPIAANDHSVITIDDTATARELEGDIDDDDDDLDDIYGPPSTSRQAGIATEPSTAMQLDHEEGEIDSDSDSGEGEDEDDSDDAMDTSDDSSSDDDEEDSNESSPQLSMTGLQEAELEPENSTTPTDQIAADVHRTRVAADDELAPELQPSTEELGVPSEQPPRPQTAFTPYVSPLSRFKDFRYHSDFLHEVPGGFKSMTYSHKIDPNKQLCPFETAGGICNDKTCIHQHFKSMALSDNDLLKTLGTLKFTSDEEAKKWKAGLTNVVKELRAKGLQQDVSAIARAISESRRTFIGDPTKTLVLD